MAARSDTEKLVRRALAYPYGPPPGSFIQIGDRTRPVPSEGIDVKGSRALLAYGANASPEALTRKLAALPPEPIPALRVSLRGWDVVYSAHVTRYGAVPAAVVASPGTVVSVHLVFPNEAQMETLTATEGQNYRLERLAGFTADLEVGGEAPAEIDAFISVHGPLLLDGSPVALAAIPAHDRVFAAMAMPELLDRVRAAIHPELTLTEFVLHHVEHGGVSPLPPLTGR